MTGLYLYQTVHLARGRARNVAGHIAVLDAASRELFGHPYAPAAERLAKRIEALAAAEQGVKNITVGYTLPKRWLKKIDIESLRIYATLDNIAMFNHMDGMDPQYNFTGSVAYSYTPSRVIAFGIDLNF